MAGHLGDVDHIGSAFTLARLRLYDRLAGPLDADLDRGNNAEPYLASDGMKADANERMA
jgi:hypothetical protein